MAQEPYDPGRNAVASSSRSGMGASIPTPTISATTIPRRLAKPAPIITPTLSPGRLASLPRLALPFPQCEPGGPANPLCSTSNQALVLALVLVGTSYLVQRRYTRWAAKRKERLSEERRQELVSALEREKGRERVDGEGEVAEAKEGESRAGRKKRRGTGTGVGAGSGVAALLHPESSVERSSAGASTPATSVSPARGRTASTASATPASASKSPISKSAPLPKQPSIAQTIPELDDAGFTLVTPHKAKGKHAAGASHPATPNGLSLIIDEQVSTAADASNAVTPTASSKRKKNKKKAGQAINEHTGSAPSIASSETSAEETIGRAAGRSASGPSDSSASSSVRPDWLMSPLGTDRDLSRSTSISSGPSGTAQDVLGLSVSDALLSGELERLRAAHAEELARVRKEAAERERRACEAALNDKEGAERALAREREELVRLRAELEEARQAAARHRESLATPQVASPPTQPNGVNGHTEGRAAAEDEMKRLKEDNARLKTELQQRAAATVTSPGRTRDQLHHNEFARLRDEIHKAQRMASHWRNRAENGERLVSQMQAGETDFQRKMAEQSTAFQQLAAQYAQARHIIQQYELAIQLERRGSAPASPMPGVNGHANGLLGAPNGNQAGSPAPSHPSTPGVNGHLQPHGMLLSPKGLSFSSPVIPAGWFDSTRGFPSQMGPTTPVSHAGGMMFGAAEASSGFVGTPGGGQPALSNSVAWSVLKNRDSLSSNASAPSGQSEGQTTSSGSLNGSQERDEQAPPESTAAEECSPRSTRLKVDLPTSSPQTLSPHARPAPSSPSGGLSPRRIIGEQLIDMAAAATERRASNASSRASAGEASPQVIGLLPSLLKVEPDNLPQNGKHDVDADLDAQSPTSDSDADAQIPVIFASVHHGPSELEAIEAMQAEHAERAKERGRQRSRSADPHNIS